MGWDYIQFMNQPEWFIDLIQIRINEEAQAKRRLERMEEAKSRRIKT